jgi:hypothetical protein
MKEFTACLKKYVDQFHNRRGQGSNQFLVEERVKDVYNIQEIVRLANK